MIYYVKHFCCNSQKIFAYLINPKEINFFLGYLDYLSVVDKCVNIKTLSYNIYKLRRHFIKN